MTSSLWKGVVKAADRLSGKIPDSGPELVAYITRKDLETKPDGNKTWKSWNNYTLTQLARELAKESRYSKYQKKECYEELIHRLLDFRFFAHMLKAIMVVEEELLLDFREAAYVLQLFRDSEIPPHIIEKEIQHPKFKERLQKKDTITLKDLIAHLQNVNYKIWVDDHQEDWGHAIRKRARRIYKYLDDPEELAIARAKAQGKPIPKRKNAQAKSKSKSSQSRNKSSKSSKTTSSSKGSSQSASKKKSRPKAKPQPKRAAPKQTAPARSKPKPQSQQQKQGDDFDFFGDTFGDNQQNQKEAEPDWLSGLNTSNLQNMSGFDVQTGATAESGVSFGFGDFDDEKEDDEEYDDDDDIDDDMENMFTKMAVQGDNLLEAKPKKPTNLKNKKGKTMAQMASQNAHSGDLNQAMAPSNNDFTNVKDPFSNLNTSSDPFADMNNQMVAKQQQKNMQVNAAFSQFGNVGGGNNNAMGGYGGGINSMNNMGMNNNNNNSNVMNSPKDLFSMNANQPQPASSIFGQVNDPFANLSAQYQQSGNVQVNATMNYGNKNKPKDAFSGLGVLK